MNANSIIIPKCSKIMVTWKEMNKTKLTWTVYWEIIHNNERVHTLDFDWGHRRGVVYNDVLKYSSVPNFLLQAFLQPWSVNTPGFSESGHRQLKNVWNEISQCNLHPSIHLSKLPYVATCRFLLCISFHDYTAITFQIMRYIIIFQYGKKIGPKAIIMSLVKQLIQ